MHSCQFMAAKLQKSVATCNSILLQDSVTLPHMETVGDRVRAARSEKGWTMDQLARAIGKKESYISELERGGIRRGSQLPRIASALDVPLKWLESGQGPRTFDMDLPPVDLADLDAAFDARQQRPFGSVRDARPLYGASEATLAAIELLSLPPAERAALVAGNAALVAGIELLETHAMEALRQRKSA